MKHVGFLLLRMNFLYSFIPLAKYLKSLGHTIHFIVPVTTDSKLNSLMQEENRRLAADIIVKHGFLFEFDVTFDELNLSHLFTIEAHGLQKLEEQLPFNVIYIQNFADFSTRCINKDSKHIYKLKHTLWLQNNFFSDIAKQIGHEQNTVIATLPGYWEYENQTMKSVRERYNVNENEKLVTCFLPREEIVWQKETHLRKIEWKTGTRTRQDLTHAINFAGLLAKKGYRIILKQRQKNRNEQLKHLSNYIEDINWYPFTSMDLSFMSDLCFGYMSMSIMDAATLGSSYINIEKNDYPEEIHDIIRQWYNDETIVGHNVYEQVHLIEAPYRVVDYRKLNDDIASSKEIIRKFIDENS